MNVRKTRRMRAVEERLGEPIEAILRRLYYDEGLTQAEVAARLSVPAGTIATWMIGFGINQRSMAHQAARDLAS
jgi:transcriptional regulator with XRE-family HTH domain